jgi:YD repeat-containing protein
MTINTSEFMELTFNLLSPDGLAHRLPCQPHHTTLTDYDVRGRPSRVLAPTGTISRAVYDGLGRVVSTWVGINDTPASGSWAPDNNKAPSNMVQSRAKYPNGSTRHRDPRHEASLCTHERVPP